MILSENEFFESLLELNIHDLNNYDLIKDSNNIVVRVIDNVPIILNGNHINDKNENNIRFPGESIRRYVSFNSNTWVEHVYEILNRTFSLKAKSNSIKPHIDNVFYNKFPDFSKITFYDENQDDEIYKLALYCNFAYNDPNLNKMRYICLESALAIEATILTFKGIPLYNIDLSKRNGPEGKIAKTIIGDLNRYTKAKNVELIPLNMVPLFSESYVLFVAGYLTWVKELDDNFQYRTDLQSDNINLDVDENRVVQNTIVNDAYTVYKKRNLILPKKDINRVPFNNTDKPIFINKFLWNKLLTFEFNRKVSNSMKKRKGENA